MYNLEANAYAVGDDVEVLLNGFLPDSCSIAKIGGTYPGNIVYIRDPGEAQVFIEESRKPGNSVCLMALVPWTRSVVLPGAAGYEKVSIYSNNDAKLTIKIEPEPENYRVLSLSAHAQPTNCSIVPANMSFIAIYTSQFGPASLEECEEWRSKNCTSI